MVVNGNVSAVNALSVGTFNPSRPSSPSRVLITFRWSFERSTAVRAISLDEVGIGFYSQQRRQLNAFESESDGQKYRAIPSIRFVRTRHTRLRVLIIREEKREMWE